MIQERSLLDLVPPVMLRRERLDVHGEERLALAEPATLELEVGDTRRDHRAELRGRELEPGLFEHLPHRRVLDGLPVVDAATGRDPPRTGLRPTGIEALLEQHAALGDQHHAGCVPFAEHRE